MYRNLVEGYDELKELLGYFPDFHDEYITDICITASCIEMIIVSELGEDKEKTDPRQYKLTFYEPTSFYLQGEFYGVVSIISEILFEKKDDMIETVLNTSLGTEGKIVAKRIKITWR